MHASRDPTGDDALVRTTTCGRVRGTLWEDDTWAWLGVPYARPPMGELRWRAPRDPVPWDAILSTEKFGSPCVQHGGLLLDLDPDTLGEPMGSEDCLYLNIWRPASGEEELPVFVYLHGGLNAVGEAATSLYHGAHLAQGARMVVVTLNYRLGILGWFAHEALRTGDPLDDSGNYGLLDILQALRWVQQNIAAFGGDRHNVTLAGESAGAFNITSLLASRLSSGLFHRALAISPLTSFIGATMSKAHRRADAELARLMRNDGLAGTRRGARQLARRRGDTWIADYLRGKDAASVLGATRPLSVLGLNSLGLTMDILGGSRFLDGTVVPRDIRDTFRHGKLQRVPYLVGSTSDEMRIFQLGLGIWSRLDEKEVCKLVQQFDPTADPVPLSSVLPRHLQPLYSFAGSTLGSWLFDRTGVEPCADLMCPHVDVFVFRFCWSKQPPPFDKLVGASHMMSLPFLFGNFQTDQSSLFRFAWCEKNREQREALSRALMAYVANFARCGDPNSGPDTGLPAWPRWTGRAGETRRLILDTPLSLGK